MEKTITIEGMMCGHCEATVKKALEALEGVASATASHEQNKAVVILKEGASLDEAAVKTAISDAGYDFVKIEQLSVETKQRTSHWLSPGENKGLLSNSLLNLFLILLDEGLSLVIADVGN